MGLAWKTRNSGFDFKIGIYLNLALLPEANMSSIGCSFVV